MNRKYGQRTVRKVLALSISTMGLTVVAPVMAQSETPSEEVLRLIRPDSEVGIGVLNVSQGKFSFGDYNGMQKKGSQLIGEVRVNKRGEDNANYVDIVGNNLGLDSQNLRIRGGEQGNYGLSFEYDQIHKLWSDSYQSPYLNLGSTSVTLPAGWVAGANTTALTAASANMRTFNLETERRSIALGLTKLLPGGWDVEVNYKREKKDGNRLIGSTYGTGGGNPKSVLLPEPVDYTTDLFGAIARYTTKDLQLQLVYSGSFFKNANSALAWVNAFTAPVAALSPAQLGLPPDNQAHQISAALGYKLTKDTRLSANLSFGRNTQNEAFLPYSNNPALTVTTAMPRSSLDGKVNTTHLDMKVTSKLTPQLSLLAAYRYDDRANKTPQSTYVYIQGDSANQAAVGGATTRTNLPGSSTKHQVEVELDYRLAAHTKLKAGYDFDYVKKTFEAITSEWEHTLKGEVHQHFSDNASGGLGYAYSDRQTSLYDASLPFNQTFSAAYVATQLPNAWDNNPYQKKFFLAPRSRDKIRAFLDFEPASKLNVHLGVDYKNDAFKESYYGLQKSQNWAEHLDANYAASDALTARAFVSLDQFTSFEKSNTLAAGCGAKGTPTNPACEWGLEIIDRGLTMGFGMTYKPAAKYQLGVDYTQSSWRGKTNIPVLGVTAGAGATPLPDNTSKLHRIDMFGTYQLEKDMSVGVKYIYERYRVADWATQDVVFNTLANVLGTNQTVPNHSVHALGVSLNYQFR